MLIIINLFAMWWTTISCACRAFHLQQRTMLLMVMRGRTRRTVSCSVLIDNESKETCSARVADRKDNWQHLKRRKASGTTNYSQSKNGLSPDGEAHQAISS